MQLLLAVPWELQRNRFDGGSPAQLRQGEAKAGTTRFRAYATAFILHAGKRVTLALTLVSAHEAREDLIVSSRPLSAAN